MHSRAQHMHRVDVENLLGTEVGPHPLETLDGAAPLMRFGRQDRGSHCAGRRPDNHLERITRAWP